MLKIFDQTDKFFNQMLLINTMEPSWGKSNIVCSYSTNQSFEINKENSIPVSNKYFLVLLDNDNSDWKNFFEYIGDDTRTISYPFSKEENIDYSFMVEPEQLYCIDIKTDNIGSISENLETFFDIVSESNGEVIFMFDINLLINNYTEAKIKSQPNHLIEFLLWRLKNKLDFVMVLDTSDNIKNNKNMLYAQFELCVKKTNANKTECNFNKNILVYKNIDANPDIDPYWNLFYPEMKITKYIGKIPIPFENKPNELSELSELNELNNLSEYDELEHYSNPSNYFQIVIIGGKECFAHKVDLAKSIEHNLMNTNIKFPIIINPVDRLNIFL